MTDTDFIIVGAGAAGCTLAREIVTRKLGSVLMLESGAVPRASRLNVPSDYLKTFRSRWDWDHRTSPQQGLGQRVVRLPAGHALGGSTAINAMRSGSNLIVEISSCGIARVGSSGPWA